jgi:hypothetical protein
MTSEQFIHLRAGSNVTSPRIEVVRIFRLQQHLIFGARLLSVIVGSLALLACSGSDKAQSMLV